MQHKLALWGAPLATALSLTFLESCHPADLTSLK